MIHANDAAVELAPTSPRHRATPTIPLGCPPPDTRPASSEAPPQFRRFRRYGMDADREGGHPRGAACGRHPAPNRPHWAAGHRESGRMLARKGRIERPRVPRRQETIALQSMTVERAPRNPTTGRSGRRSPCISLRHDRPASAYRDNPESTPCGIRQQDIPCFSAVCEQGQRVARAHVCQRCQVQIDVFRRASRRCPATRRIVGRRRLPRLRS